MIEQWDLIMRQQIAAGRCLRLAHEWIVNELCEAPVQPLSHNIGGAGVLGIAAPLRPEWLLRRSGHCSDQVSKKWSHQPAYRNVAHAPRRAVSTLLSTP